ncbi:MAG TPA: chemotaxis protein CheB [Stellaceae bacterium]|nr:chemotaxis protein CheB [Stellaceae bacterium]
MRSSGGYASRVDHVFRDIVVIGGSAGALDAMISLVEGLPEDYQGSLFIVSHIGMNPSQLPRLLDEAGPLHASHPVHEEHVRRGRIYVAPPDRHLLLADRQILLSSLPREHFTRPAIDPLFRSAARTYGARVIGIVLSGTGNDGALGLAEIRKAGGIVVVQDPAEAVFPEMPETVRRTVKIDHVVPSSKLAELLTELVAEPAAAKSVTEDPNIATKVDLETPFALTCPECGGAIHEVPGSRLLSYRCHTGHRFSADDLLTHQVGDIERALMVAVRVLCERTALCRRMMEEAKEAGRTYGMAHWTRLKEEADDQLRVLLHFLHLQSPAESEQRSSGLSQTVTAPE